jgi:proton-translocating NAD(P)+ transhydrogenase subunit beta
MEAHLLNIIYLISSVLFVIGLKMLSHPETARRGNLWAALGMLMAIAGTIVLHHHTSLEPIKIGLIIGGIVIGTIIGAVAARKVKMTKMPEMVSLFNGMGGACAGLISLIEFSHLQEATAPPSMKTLFIIVTGLIIGSISFSGSMIAFIKLNGTLPQAIRLPNYNLINNIWLLLTVCAAGFIVATGITHVMFIYVVFLMALAYGVLFVVPIGGADMPVVISLLNSFTGVAAAFGGFLYHNQVMLTGGILVGSAGTLLTIVMCKAMNRPLFNVIFGAFGENHTKTGASQTMVGTIKDISISDLAVLMNYSKRVIIVPGYGLAVAQAQHVIHELENLLEERGVEVKYAIHPVAGRMPGHMNVLLAESNVPYEKLVEMEEINPEFPNTDVVLVVGANDVVNPAAHNDPSSPIYGMPILDVENAHHIVVNKRSMNAGYAGIENELFYNPKTSMLFGDAKAVLTKLVAELKTL